MFIYKIITKYFLNKQILNEYEYENTYIFIYHVK